MPSSAYRDSSAAITTNTKQDVFRLYSFADDNLIFGTDVSISK